MTAHIVKQDQMSFSPARSRRVKVVYEFFQVELNAILIICPFEELEKPDAVRWDWQEDWNATHLPFDNPARHVFAALPRIGPASCTAHNRFIIIYDDLSLL